MLLALHLFGLPGDDMNMLLDMLEVCLPPVRMNKVITYTLVISYHKRSGLSRELVLLVN